MLLFTHCYCIVFSFFFFNDTATTEIYTLSLHDALPIFGFPVLLFGQVLGDDDPPIGHDAAAQLLVCGREHDLDAGPQDRKSTRLNSSHANISYAVFCLKKKKTKQQKLRQYKSDIELLRS